jgi:uncharacterized protein (DUF1778 family)
MTYEGRDGKTYSHFSQLPRKDRHKREKKLGVRMTEEDRMHLDEIANYEGRSCADVILRAFREYYKVARIQMLQQKFREDQVEQELKSRRVIDSLPRPFPESADDTQSQLACRQSTPLSV